MLKIGYTRAMLPILLLCGLPALASAQTAQSTPNLQDASITGFGSTITINRLPIGIAGNKLVFKDVTITLTTTDGTGTLKSSAKVTQTNSPVLNTSNIVAGQYSLSNNGNFQMIVSGPASIGNGGEAKWTTVTVNGNEPCGTPNDFYTGPLKANPLYSRLQAAGITSPEYSYGVIDGGTPCGSPFAEGALIGVSQVGNELQIATFTNNGQDQSSPVTSEIFNLIQ